MKGKKTTTPLIKTNGIKKGRFWTKSRRAIPSIKYSVYVAKSDETASFRLSFIIFSLGLAFSSLGNLISSPSKNIVISLQDFVLSTDTPAILLLGFLAFTVFNIFENFGSFNLMSAVISWTLAGFIIGLINGSTKGDGILILLIRTIVKMVGLIVIISIVGAIFLWFGGASFANENVFLSFAFVIILGILFLTFIPLSFLATLGYSIGERLHHE